MVYIKSLVEGMYTLKSICFLVSGVSIFDLSTLFTAFPYNLINEKRTEYLNTLLKRGFFI